MIVYVYGLYKKNFEYTYHSIDDGLFYIGITKSLRTRINGHKNPKEKSNPLKKSYINNSSVSTSLL